MTCVASWENQCAQDFPVGLLLGWWIFFHVSYFYHWAGISFISRKKAGNFSRQTVQTSILALPAGHVHRTCCPLVAPGQACPKASAMTWQPLHFLRDHLLPVEELGHCLVPDQACRHWLRQTGSTNITLDSSNARITVLTSHHPCCEKEVSVLTFSSGSARLAGWSWRSRTIIAAFFFSGLFSQFSGKASPC